jgi:hypothetical protein
MYSLLAALALSGQAPIEEKRFLYVAVPGIRNEVEHGGVSTSTRDTSSSGASRHGR